MKVPPILWASLSPGAARAVISLYLYSAIGRCFISSQVQETLPLVAQNICPVSSAIAFMLVTYQCQPGPAQCQCVSKDGWGQKVTEGGGA